MRLGTIPRSHLEIDPDDRCWREVENYRKHVFEHLERRMREQARFAELNARGAQKAAARGACDTAMFEYEQAANRFGQALEAFASLPDTPRQRVPEGAAGAVAEARRAVVRCFRSS